MKKIQLIALLIFISIFGFGQNSNNQNSTLNTSDFQNNNETKLSLSTQPSQNSMSLEIYERDAIYAGKKPADEVIDRRDRTSKHFRNADGSFEAMLSTGSMNYLENGQWKTIQRNYVSNQTGNHPDFEFANTTNSFHTFLSSQHENGIMTQLPEGAVTEWINKKIEWLDENYNSIGELLPNNAIMSVKESKAEYTNIFPHTNALITQGFDGRGIDYEITSSDFLNLIPNSTKYISVTETIELPTGWTAKYYYDSTNESQPISKQQISIFDENGNEILRYMPPKYFEKNNEAEGDIGEYQFVQHGQLLTISTIVPIDWIQDNQRVFPLVIDPTVNVYPNNSSNWTRSANGNGSNFTNLRFGIGTDGNWYVSGMKFNTSSISSGSTVSAVRGYFYITEAYEAWGGQVQFAYSADPTTNSGSNLYNGVTGALSSSLAMVSPNPGWKSIALNSTGVAHVQNNISSSVNLGLNPLSGYSYYGQYYAAVNHTNANRPYLAITYTAPSGPPSCATLISPTNGATGVGHSGTLEWNTSGGATGYDVYFGTASTPPLVSTNQGGTTYTVGPCLLPSTTYYWKVIPKNNDGSASGCETWSFTTDNKLHIYKNDFETASEGYFGTSGASVDGWYANNTDGMTFGYDYYQNIWTIGTGPHAISGKSVGVSGLKNGGLAGDFFDYWTDLGTLYRWIYRPIDLTGLRDVELTFRWKGQGESGQDFGTVATSINSGTNWLTDEQGGLYSDGKYWNSESTIRTQTLTFPNTRNNQGNFQLAFKWNDLSGNGYGGANSFVVDDIVMKACPYEGVIKSSQHAAGVFEWTPTGSSQTTLTIIGSHQCAQYAWEQSTNVGSSWVAAVGGSGANTQSYTTPADITSNIWYRCKVYFGTGCTGVYQENPFKFIFTLNCVSNISPVNLETNVSSNTTLTWNTDVLATSYDVYFGTSANPPFVANVTTNSYPVTTTYNTTYYWKIIPKNINGEASGCDIWSFSTSSIPPIFHNKGGAVQLAFNNSTVQNCNPIFRISHPTAATQYRIQINNKVTFPTATNVFDGTFSGSYAGNTPTNFTCNMSSQIIDNNLFPQGFDTNVLTTGGTAPDNTWFAPNSHTPFTWTATGGNPDGRVGYSGAWNNNWSNFLRLPEVNCTGQDQVTLTFDVWHSYFAAQPNDWIKFNQWADGAYQNNVVSVKINGVNVTYDSGVNGKGFKFSEVRDAAQVEVTFDISAISDKSNILFYLNVICGYNNSNVFYVYFDNIAVHTATPALLDNTTYYARAQAKIGTDWTSWSPDTFSFTYKPLSGLEWYQTMAPQFETGELDNVIAIESTTRDYATLSQPSGSGINPFANPSFETSSSWTTYATGGSEVVITASDGANWKSQGSRAARMYMYGGYAMSSDVGIISQVIDLTGVDQIIFDAQSHYGPNMFSSLSNGGTLRLIIGGTSSNTIGTTYATVNHCVSGSSSCSNETLNITANIPPTNRIPNQLVKFVWTGFTGGDLGGALVSFMVDNIRAGVNEINEGTITSTPIELASFLGATAWDKFFWDQRLNDGAISYKIQKDVAGTWQDISGLTTIAGPANRDTIDITSAGNSAIIRLVGTFNKGGAILPEMNHWGVWTNAVLPIDLLSFNVFCNNDKVIIAWTTASETNNDFFTIEKSKNLKDWVIVGNTAGGGNNNSQTTYSMVDKADALNWYYRLKQTDFDGKFEYFSPVSIHCGSDFSLQINIYPNPTEKELYCSIVTNKEMDVTIQIVNYLGQLCHVENHSIGIGANTIDISSHYSPGIYLVKVISNATVLETKKIVIQ